METIQIILNSSIFIFILTILYNIFSGYYKENKRQNNNKRQNKENIKTIKSTIKKYERIIIEEKIYLKIEKYQDIFEMYNNLCDNINKEDVIKLYVTLSFDVKNQQKIQDTETNINNINSLIDTRKDIIHKLLFLNSGSGLDKNRIYNIRDILLKLDDNILNIIDKITNEK